jgi:ABC-type lipoprotein export system ATPase subunit
MASRNAGGIVQLVQVDIERFRSCISTTIKPHPKLSALIGINGAGKTNVLSALRLLRVGDRRFMRTEPATRPTEAMLTAVFVVDDKKVGLRLRLQLSESNRGSDEVAHVDELWNFYGVMRGWRRIPPFALLDARQQLSGDQERSLFLYEKEMFASGRARFDFEVLDQPGVMDCIRAVNDFRTGISYYSASQFTEPSRCPSSFEVDEDGRLTNRIQAERHPHLKFIYDLYRLKSESKETYLQYCRFVSRAQLGLVSRLTWKEIILSSNTAEVKSGGKVKRVKQTKTMVIPKVQIGSSYMTFNQLSEGTFKTLALVFYIMTDAARCIMIEEPEVCVHHGLLSRIVSTIRAYSDSKQVIMSTHSDMLVDSLEPENIFVVEMLKQGTSVSSLNEWLDKAGKEALHTYLAESGTLGEYWRTGGLAN